MANKIGVLEHYQAVSDTPSHFIKRRVSNQLVSTGYAKRLSRWAIQMLSVKFKHALTNVIHADSGQLNAEGPPECSFATYPVRDMRSAPKPFGYSQDWAHF